MSVHHRRLIISRYGAKVPGGGIQFCAPQGGKVIFLTVQDALNASKELAEVGSDRMKPYRCPVQDTDHFHLRTVKAL